MPPVTSNGFATTPALAARVFFPFALGYFLSYMFRTVNSVIAPNLVADTGIDAASLGFLTSAFFLAFACIQLPLGMLLDRFGPRRVEAGLLMVAAAGALLFSVGDTLATLTLGRALIGLGVSACMMAGFKAFTLWFPRGRLPLVNGCLLAVGGTGALAATAPVEWALGHVDWRVLFLGLLAFTLLVAFALIVVVPPHPQRPAHTTVASQLSGIATVYRDAFFWRIAPITVVSQGTFLATQGLWAGPWLRDVAGLGRDAVALHLLALGAAIVSGFFVSGVVAERLGRRGIGPGAVAVWGMGVFLCVQIGLLFAPGALILPLWVGFGLVGVSGTLSYAALSQHFHGSLSGRANTGLNVMVFLAAFLVQWCFGLLLAQWEDPVTRTYGAEGYHWGFALMLTLQAIALAWYALGRYKGAGH